jgi:hypothetical protein
MNFKWFSRYQNTNQVRSNSEPKPLTMARITPNGISGSIGNVVYYVIGDKQYGKGKSRPPKQTEATKVSAGKFGVAAGCARRIRERTTPFITPVNNLNLRNRLTSAVYEWVLSRPANSDGALTPVSTLVGFDFNEQSPMRKYMIPKIQADWSRPGVVTVNIPSIDTLKDIKAPRYNTVSIDLWVCLTSFLVDALPIKFSRTHMIQLPYREGSVAPKELEFNVDILPDSMNVLSMGLRYNVGGGGGTLPEKSPKWLPASIVDAVYKGKLVS